MSRSVSVILFHCLDSRRKIVLWESACVILNNCTTSHSSGKGGFFEELCVKFQTFIAFDRGQRDSWSQTNTKFQYVRLSRSQHCLGTGGRVYCEDCDRIPKRGFAIVFGSDVGYRDQVLAILRQEKHPLPRAAKLPPQKHCDLN